MSLLQILESFVEEKEWDDEVESIDESGTCRISTELEIAGQDFELVVYGEEDSERLILYLMPPFRALDTKLLECCQLFNYLNDRYLYAGMLSLDKGGRIMYKNVLDTDDIDPVPALIHNMLKSGWSLFTTHIEAIAAVAVTTKRFDEVLAEYEKKAAMKAARDNGN